MIITQAQPFVGSLLKWTESLSDPKEKTVAPGVVRVANIARLPLLSIVIRIPARAAFSVVPVALASVTFPFVWIPTGQSTFLRCRLLVLVVTEPRLDVIH